MARFTFGGGNARKLLRVPLYAIGALATLVIPRSSRRWVVGSGIGLGEGALPLARAARTRFGDSVRLVWLATTPAELDAARAAGFESARKTGWRGFWLTARARVAIVTHGFGDVNRYAVGGAFVVQLWHGIPLKRLHLDSPAALRVSGLPDHPLVRSVIARALRTAGRRIGLFPVSSALTAARVATAFGISRERIVVTGDPRVDVLFEPGDALARLDRAAGPLFPGSGSARRILYAPTWRDGARDPGIPDDEEWRRIAEWLDAHDAILYVRVHPLGVGDYAAGPRVSPRIRSLGPESVTDVNAILSAIDLVITDYSSIAYDFALLERPMVFFAPDVETYARRRGLYDPYRVFSGDRRATTWDETLAAAATAMDPVTGAPARAHARWLRHEYVDVIGGGATERVLDEILVRTATGTGTADATGRLPVELRPRPRARARIDGSVLRVEIEGPVAEAWLEGSRARVDGVVHVDGERSAVELPLVGERWGDAGLAVPSGDYVLAIRTGAGVTSRVDVDPDPSVVRSEDFRAVLSGDDGRLVVRMGPPLADDELGPRAQRRLERAYRRARPSPENSVFLESFYGQAAACNPHGIDRELARVLPDVTRYWSVVDGSVAIPEGGIRLIEGSREWWRVRGSARVLIVNDWLRKRFRRRAHQRVLQTWHGTMLKRLALDRAGRGLRTRIAILRERDRWDALLAQNEYSATVFRSAYAMRDPIWIEGYPRNDVLARADGGTDVRARLGVSPAARLVLYAPTWRDDLTAIVDFVDLARFAGELGDDHVLLVRGHSRTLRSGEDLRADHLLDVTSYPNMSDLLRVADVLVTDYSSVMFDFAATGKPIILFTPDLRHYADDLRGFYFDLLADAPGPVVTTRDDLRDEIIRSASGRRPPAAYAERAAAWRARFTPLDDGNAGARVVQRLRDEGWLP